MPRVTSKPLDDNDGSLDAILRRQRDLDLELMCTHDDVTEYETVNCHATRRLTMCNACGVPLDLAYERH